VQQCHEDKLAFRDNKLGMTDNAHTQRTRHERAILYTSQVVTRQRPLRYLMRCKWSRWKPNAGVAFIFSAMHASCEPATLGNNPGPPRSSFHQTKHRTALQSFFPSHPRLPAAPQPHHNRAIGSQPAAFD
jgi:hypothetical protein